MQRVMLVEDDARLAALVKEYLGEFEYEVDVVARGDRALERFGATRPDLVILDLTLPGIDGMVVCRQLRQLSPVPILILTAREDMFDEVSGLEQGADDYVNKPIQPRVLLARLRALQRRGSAPVDSDVVVGALRISRANRAVFWRDGEVAMNGAEFKLFLILAEAAGKVLSRNDILIKMRGIEFDGLDRSIDNCISRLRRKFDDGAAERIKTVWGEGYLFSPSAWE
ncbi:two component transcriptional regulator, winged helix family [Duganella sp. CF517]|uniref:response regulator n=1 Tax=Duganella sp. CF517 TaxID=1881038 RepID=UPI0008D0B53E|nr:response regulator [Duganella sp. CF517]SEN65486.1 two component transcriptional regulator, winged helix family [Duganella sp. CF517]